MTNPITVAMTPGCHQMSKVASSPMPLPQRTTAWLLGGRRGSARPMRTAVSAAQ